ncbi:hypothetical protein B0J11DRAFT_582843 [Dendryphion nanum]|uniref:Uncharacterized protein n=1 Tax=Dendryphion nanum TaxID=256645 RepID=A0A9P9DH44_9PLEO|nr:hypothetical protein B0J11DRAFT_582843 [Dendryphion nanum]
MNLAANMQQPNDNIQESKLLQLPRELRDIICGYTLYAPGGLYYYRDRPYKASLCASEDSTAEFNQLKYTCRILYYETVGLELTSGNNLIFVFDESRKNEYMSQQPAVQFLGFLDLSSPCRQRKIRRVYLRNGFNVEDYGIRDLHLIVYWCQLHPTARVFWEFPVNYDAGQKSPSWFLSDGLALECAMRNTSATIDRRARELGVYLILGQITVYREAVWRRDLREQGLGYFQKLDAMKTTIEAENFRALPYDGPLDEQAFWVGMPGTDEIKMKALELARSWYRDGF